MNTQWLPLCLVSAALALVAGRAAACPPSALDSTFPSTIKLVGTHAGVADPVGEFDVVVRGLAGQIVRSSYVVLDFSDAVSTGSVRLADQQPAGVIVDCASHTIRTVSDDQGIARIRVIGAARHDRAARDARVSVYADGVLFGQARVAAFDENGANGVSAADVAAFADDLFGSGYGSRSDFNGDGVLNGLDLASLTTVLFRGGSTESAVTWCP
ncbi:MAG TPA: hypothetical protein VL332_10105 [Candidatus Saccharimonadaceae bacterium]|jgi:hypothetical protein|nr:hypothetical protein [Candidatus Saccharimonadaceae bacterium]